MSTEGLLPCPFCGSCNLCRSHGNQILCFDCGAEGPTVARSFRGPSFGDQKAALWNRRAAPPPPEVPTTADGTPYRWDGKRWVGQSVPPPHEAAGPGHVFVPYKSHRELCGHPIGFNQICGLLPSAHAVPPIPEGTK